LNAHGSSGFYWCDLSLSAYSAAILLQQANEIIESYVAYLPRGIAACQELP
jgi:hypothetical protein